MSRECEASWPAEPYDEDGEYWPDDYAVACDEPATHRALVRAERRNGAESVEVTHVCPYHACDGDLRLDQLPALYP